MFLWLWYSPASYSSVHFRVTIIIKSFSPWSNKTSIFGTITKKYIYPFRSLALMIHQFLSLVYKGATSKTFDKSSVFVIFIFFMWTNLCYALVIQENNYTIVRMFFFLPNLSCHLQHATSSVKTMAPVLFRMVWLGAYVQETGVEGCVITAPSATALLCWSASHV